MWDPTTYLRYSDERSRPFFDLLARVEAHEPATVVDLGCGPGNLTVHLAQRWPHAAVRGVDASAEMIAAAQSRPGTVRFEVGDVRDWHATPDVGVVVCNAVLHWVPGHESLLERWTSESPGAWLAFQVPGNFASPAYELIREVAARRGLADLVPGDDVVRDAVGYALMLVALGCEVDAWETTYVHQLPVSGEDHPVLSWFEGTGLRAIRSTVDDDGWAAFRAELNPRLDAAYPSRAGRVSFGDAREPNIVTFGEACEPNIVMFPFRRIFVVSRGRA